MALRTMETDLPVPVVDQVWRWLEPGTILALLGALTLALPDTRAWFQFEGLRWLYVCYSLPFSVTSR
ncbi:MAG: hypothetical protein U0412_10425 [Nitrospira sp.]